MRPRVFVVQEQRVLRAGRYRAKFDLSPAEVFGDLIFVLPPDTKPTSGQSVITAMHDSLKTINTKDFVLLVGNPVLIGWCVAIASHYLNGAVRCLQWETSRQSYVPISGELFSYS